MNCINDEHKFTKVHTFLLRFDLEEEQVKESMIKWAKTLVMTFEWINGGQCG